MVYWTVQQATACSFAVIGLQNNTTARAESEDLPGLRRARVGVNLHLNWKTAAAAAAHSRGRRAVRWSMHVVSKATSDLRHMDDR